MESHADWFDALASALARHGFSSCAYDRRGWGHSPGTRGDLASGQAALDEFARVFDALFSAEQRVHVLGLSWGGLFAVHALAAQSAHLGPRLASLTLVSPALAPTRTIPWASLLQIFAGGVPLPIAVDDFTSDPVAKAFIEADRWRVRKVSGRFLLTTRRWLKEAPKALAALPPSLPRHLALAPGDTLIDVGATRALAAANGFSISSYPDKRHSLIFEAPEALATDVAAFASAPVGGGTLRGN